MSCDKKGKITALWKIEEHEVFVEEFVVIFVVISHIYVKYHIYKDIYFFVLSAHPCPPNKNTAQTVIL